MSGSIRCFSGLHQRSHRHLPRLAMASSYPFFRFSSTAQPVSKQAKTCCLKVNSFRCISNSTERTRNLAGFSVPQKLDLLPAEVRERILKVQEKSGFVPNVFLLLARRPAEFKAFFDYYEALMASRDDAGTLTMEEKEMIVVATSAENKCQYCVIAHSAILRVISKDQYTADQIAVNYEKTPLSNRQRAILEYAVAVCRHSHTLALPEKDSRSLELLQTHGLTLEDLWDILSITAFFAMSNRLANAANLVPNAEFFALGRHPADK